MDRRNPTPISEMVPRVTLVGVACVRFPWVGPFSDTGRTLYSVGVRHVALLATISLLAISCVRWRLPRNDPLRFRSELRVIS